MNINVTDFGAKPDLTKVQTKAFQKAIDYCYKTGGGEVFVPSGTYIIGDIRLRSNITLHLLENAVIKGSSNINDYINIYDDNIEPLPSEQATKAKWVTANQHFSNGGGLKKHLYTAGSYWNYGIIRAVYAENVSIIGERGSVIDGENLYDPNGEENYRGPHGINMHFCKNIRFAGYTIKNTGNWAHAIFQSQDIIFNNLTVLGGHDALHTRSCKNITMSDCKLITGDDCIAGFDCVNVKISKCEISSACSAFRFGGHNVLIEKCNVYGPCKYQFRGSFSLEEKQNSAQISSVGRNNTLCFFTYFVTDDLPQQKAPGNIVIRNCKVNNVDKMLHINLSGNETWQRGNPPSDITFKNIIANDIKTGFYGYGDGIVKYRLNLNNVIYKVAEGFETEPLMKVAHFGSINIKNTKIFNYKGNSFIKTWSDNGTVNTENLTCDIKANELLIRATDKFTCKPI